MTEPELSGVAREVMRRNLTYRDGGDVHRRYEVIASRRSNGIRGDVPEGPIALVHADCDWYDPVRAVLERVSPHVSPGR